MSENYFLIGFAPKVSDISVVRPSGPSGGRNKANFYCSEYENSRLYRFEKYMNTIYSLVLRREIRSNA